MANVYDAIEEFYRNDAGWEQVIPQADMEAYFRHLAWHGICDRELQHRWELLVMLCIYIENAEMTLDEMTEDDVIDMVSWCGRNVVDYQISYDSVRDFLDTVGTFFVFLKQQGKLENSLAPYLARQQLLKDDGTLAIIDRNGNYLPGEEKRERKSAPPSEGRVFLNAGESLNGLMGEIHQFFQKEEFNLDFERSVTLYEYSQGVLDVENDGMDRFWRGYWDYFLFDYHLIEGDIIPLEYFRRHGNSAYPQLVNELCMGFLSIFTIEEMVDEDRFVCRDFLTGEPYFLAFPLEGDAPLEDRVYMGHVFYNRSMGMNYLQSFVLKPLARKRLLEVLNQCRDWYDVQRPGVDWAEFLERESLVCRTILRQISQNPAGCSFPYTTRQEKYLPRPLPEKLTVVEKLAQELLLVSGRSDYDVELVRHMWQDFLAREPFVGGFEPQVWASALLENFLEINEKRAAQKKPFFLETYGVSNQNLNRAYMEIRTQLKLEPSDPRYLDELGFLMLFSKFV
ncbi:hypothetical protein [Acidaminococcus timonensis]|uniref:hypothetical protein n=1 Tax=Acidaminococcus timonensis TaxID=1871002 RepID=UPI003078A417